MKRIAIQAGSHVIHVRKIATGNRPAVLLIHGVGVSGDYYINYAEKLAPFFDVYIVDLPGYGKTPKPPEALSIRELAETLSDYVVTSGIKNFIIVGHSMGAQIVAHTVRMSPALFKKVILLSPTTNRKERSILLQGFHLLQDIFHESLNANITVLKNYIQMGLRRYVTTAHYMVGDHIEDSIKDITLPVLIVYGSKDRIVPKEWATFLGGVAPKGSVVEMNSAPHLLQYEKPDELVRITRKFTQP